MQFQDIVPNVFVPRNRYIVENILFGKSFGRMCQEHHDNVIRMTGVFIKLEAFIRMM